MKGRGPARGRGPVPAERGHRGRSLALLELAQPSWPDSSHLQRVCWAPMMSKAAPSGKRTSPPEWAHPALGPGLGKEGPRQLAAMSIFSLSVCTHTHAHVHKQAHTHVHKQAHMCTHDTHAQSHVHMYAHMCVHTRTNRRVHTCTRAQTGMHVHTRHTQAHTHVHTYAYMSAHAHTKGNYLACDPGSSDSASSGSSGRMRQWTLMFPFSSCDNSARSPWAQEQGRAASRFPREHAQPFPDGSFRFPPASQLLKTSLWSAEHCYF